MFLLTFLMSFIFIATFQDMAEAAPKDVHVHFDIHDLNKNLANLDTLGENKSGMLGWIQLYN